MRKSLVRRERIRDFWNWFSASEKNITDLYESNRLRELALIVNEQLDTIHDELPWEIGPGKTRKYSFTLSPEGNERLARVVNQAIAAAPKLPRWEFYSSRQPRSAPKVVRLPDTGISFKTTGWKFHGKLQRGRVDLVILDHELSCAGRESAAKAVSIFLDQFLGEAVVERAIGKIEIGVKTKAKSFPISDLPDYLQWVQSKSNSTK